MPLASVFLLDGFSGAFRSPMMLRAFVCLITHSDFGKI